MRQTSGSTSLWSPVCLTGVPHQRLSTPQRIGISRSRPRCSPVASPPRPHGGLVYSREGQVKRFGSLGRQAEESQSSADLQAFTDWLSESGCQGITGDTHKVEIYQYGEDGRGLRATKVLHPCCSHSTVSPATSTACLPSMSAGQRKVQDVSQDNAVLQRK